VGEKLLEIDLLVERQELAHQFGRTPTHDVADTKHRVDETGAKKKKKKKKKKLRKCDKAGAHLVLKTWWRSEGPPAASMVQRAAGSRWATGGWGQRWKKSARVRRRVE
jgi:hypothetical protein